MPGTHLLPPNLLKLFAPRPPLPYARPVDRDIDRIHSKAVSGVASILTQLKETADAQTVAAGTNDAIMEDGEEPTLTHAEEVKRQLRREERRKKRTEEFKIAKETCVFFVFISVSSTQFSLSGIDKPADDSEAIGDPYKTLFISRLVCSSLFSHSSALHFTRC